MQLERKPHYVASPLPRTEPYAPDARSAVLDHIRKTIVTSRLTLAGESAGVDPYDSRCGRGPGSVWLNRVR